ncbi:MAG TPA: hypothetical protein VN843_08265 [Anaerolineales bacterium]|nr:hypothetical protein [Anaerolineales bacterium]
MNSGDLRLALLDFFAVFLAVAFLGCAFWGEDFFRVGIVVAPLGKGILFFRSIPVPNVNRLENVSEVESVFVGINDDDCGVVLWVEAYYPLRSQSNRR